MNSATYQVEPYCAVREEVRGLLALHWAEIAQNRDKIKLAVDEDAYERMQVAGLLHIVTARVDGRLIGYCVHFVNRHLHYKNDLMAGCDIYFIHPDHRRGRIGLQLFAEVERTLKARGVKKIIFIVNCAHDHRAIFHRLGYADTEMVLTKYVGD